MEKINAQTATIPDTIQSIGVISDTHGQTAALLQAMRLLGPCDAYLHAGDVLTPYRYTRRTAEDRESMIDRLRQLPILYVARGNCDEDDLGIIIQHNVCSSWRLHWRDFTLFLTHGHNPAIELWLASEESVSNAIFISGHSHRSKLQRMDQQFILNPGSPAFPREEYPTAARIDTGGIRLINVLKGDTKSFLRF